jgi:hypothetical protein
MPVDKSLFYYGRLYHRLFDPPLAQARRVAVELIPARRTVLDLACGTGELCFALRTARAAATGWTCRCASAFCYAGERPGHVTFFTGTPLTPVTDGAFSTPPFCSCS